VSARCASPLAFPVLVDYWLGEIEDAQAIEEHLLGCEHCSGRLEWLAALDEGIRAVFRRGAVHAVLSRGMVQALKGQGLRLREYRVAAGASVQCTIGAADDFVLSRLEAPLSGVRRLDLEVLDAAGEARSRLEDIPFDPAAGEVLMLPAAAHLRKQPAHVERLRLVAIEEDARRALGEYTFVHTPG
jgi:hypothetical protein